MSFPSDHLYDVLIAGAGPVGLWLACELRLGGCSVLVLETTATPDAPLKHPPFGLRGLTVPTIEALDRRGLLDPIRVRAADGRAPGTAHWSQQPRRPAGHFAGIPFFQDQVDVSPRSSRDADHLAIDMASLEAVLTSRAEALGARIQRGYTVDCIEQSQDVAVVEAGGERFMGRWLVGCDGGRSAVRKAAGIGFTGTNPELTGYSVEVELADPSVLVPGRHYTACGMYLFNPPRTIAMADFDGGAFHRTAPVTREHVERVLRQITGTDVQVTALDIAATWTDRAFQATEYRKGRVLLAGDAAHVHSPLGGQGLNLGLGDAMNLGWKLASTIHGTAPDNLLDTYERERRPVGAMILDWSRAQVALMRPSPSSRALAAVVRDLIATRNGATYFAERIRGLDLRYDLGSDHPLVGQSAPDVTLTEGIRLNERLRDGRSILLDLGVNPTLASLAERWNDRLSYVRSQDTVHPNLAAMLVRPDGVVAWAGSGPIDFEGFGQAVLNWFGEPNAPGALGFQGSV